MLNDVISMEFSVSRSAVSHHLRILRNEGVVAVEPDGGLPQSRLYRLNDEYLERLDDAVGELFALWDHRYGTGARRAPIYPAIPSRTPHAHRAGRKGLRGEGRGQGLGHAGQGLGHAGQGLGHAGQGHGHAGQGHARGQGSGREQGPGREQGSGREQGQRSGGEEA